MVVTRDRGREGSHPSEQGGSCRLSVKTPGAEVMGDCAVWLGTMSWIPVWLLLLAQCTGGGPQLALHQPPSGSSALGTTVRLACTLSRDHSVGLHSIYWYQQRPGHPPRFLLQYFLHSNQRHGPGIPPRFSGSKDVAQNSGYLIISELRPEDEAVYYCAMGSLEEEVERKRGEEEEPAASGSQVPKDSAP